MKIGIMSMQRIKNYGSFLQAYALKKIIEEHGHEVVFVDYHVENPLIQNSKKKFNVFKGISALKGKAPIKQKLQYINHKRNFNKYFNILGFNDEMNYQPKLDILVIGSDEVFNCIQDNPNVGYSLELFGKNNKAKKVITYAASFGNTTLDKIKEFKKQTELSELLCKIDKISVRDQNSYNTVKELTPKTPKINLDPVLVFNYMNRTEVPKINIPKKKYLIIYAYAGRIKEAESRAIKAYADKNNLDIYAIGSAQKYATKFIDCSPFEVLSYFKNATYIVTDTFHGSIFSIINNKPFATIIRKSTGHSYGNEEKLSDLLDRLKLSNQKLYNITDLEAILDKKINYSETNSIIENERKRALKFFEENLK